MKKDEKKNKNEQKAISPHPYRSRSKMKVPSSIQGLVTNKQSIMSKTESQISEYSQKTDKTYTSRSQDLLAQEEDQQFQGKQVFVNQQEQKAIQKILEVARKGKINQGNAFNLPLKVLENQNLSEKFWKFASQLLKASMHIYDKRIDNTWASTNSIQSQLIRMTGEMKNSEQTEDNEQQQQADRNQDRIKVTLEQFRNPKNLENMAAFMGFLEENENLNKKFDQFLPIKPIKSTDSSNLLVNTFNMNNDRLQLSSQKKHNINNIQNKISQEWDEKMLLIMKDYNAFHKNISITSQIFQSKKILEKQVKQPELLNYDEFSQTALFNQLNFEALSFHEKASSFNDEIHTQIPYHPHSEQNLTPFEESRPFQIASDGLFGMSECDHSFHSVMTPWQYQFKEGKLRKAKMARKNKKNDVRKPRIKKQKQEPGFIEFKNMVLSKKIVFKKRSESKISDDKVIFDKNLLAPQLAIYEKIVYNKSNRIRNKAQGQPRNEIPDFLGPDPSEGIPQYQKQNEKLTSHHADYQDYAQLEPFSADQGREKASIMDLRSIKNKKQHFRETQKFLYQKLKEDRQVRLNQMIDVSQEKKWNISQQQIFLGFLHIAASKNLTLKENYQQSVKNDIVLSYQ